MINFLLAFLPSFLHVRIRRLLGAQIGKGSKIRFATILRVNNKKLVIGEEVTLGPLTYIAARELSIANNSIIKPLVMLSTAYVKLSEYSHIAPTAIIRSSFTENSRFELGKHSRVFPYCWLDTGEGIFIGNEVGVGGHTLIFTHGSWPNYIDGGPVSFGPVTIEDNVWIPWRVFILPGVTIGANSVIGANATVNKSLPAQVLAAGSPAKILKEDIGRDVPTEEKEERLMTVIKDYANFLQKEKGVNCTVNTHSVTISNWKLIINNKEEAKAGDIVFFTDTALVDSLKTELINNKVAVIDNEQRAYYNKIANNSIDDFVFYIRKFGIRLEYKK